MQKPVIVLTLGFTTGVLLGRGFLYFPCSVLVAVAAALLGVLFFLAREKISFRRLVLFALPSIAGIAAYLYSAAYLPADHYCRLIANDNSLHEITGTIVSSLDRDPDRTGFLLRAHTVDHATATGLLRVTVREAATSIGYADLVTVSAKLYVPGRYINPHSFDYAEYLAQSGVHHLLTVKTADQVRVLRSGTGLFRTIQDWRERIRRSFLTATSGRGSAILQAMVLGEEGELTDEMRDQFLAAGVTHIISISGSHLGMVALLCFGVVRLIMRLLPQRLYLQLTLSADPKKIAALTTLPLVIFYTLLAGGQMATVRSLLMVVAALAALIFDRENALLHSLASAALLILVFTPQALFDISFQLSFISVAAIGFVVRLWSELPFRREGFLRKTVLSLLLLVIISLATSLATGPLVAHYFNQFSFAGILSNMIVVPFAGIVVVPLGLFSGILSLFTGQLPLAGLNQAVADWFLATVSFFSRLPLAEFHLRAPGILWLLCYASLIISLSALVRTRLLFLFDPLLRTGRVPLGAIVTAVLSSLVLGVLTLPVFFDQNKLRLSFPDVGQGDCALLELPGGSNILIDGGGSADERFDMGRRVLGPFLWNRGVRKLDLVILSHPHPDHMNGLKFILSKFEVSEVWTHERDADLPGYDQFNRVLTEKKIRRILVSPDRPAVHLGEAEILVLHPDPAFTSYEKRAYAAENDNSLVVKVRAEGAAFLFPGDIGIGAEKRLLQQNADVKCDLLKVPHHGSRSSSSEEFVSAARPSVAVLTVGRRNTYRHPSPEVVERYERIGSTILRTDRDGAIFLMISNGVFRSARWNELELARIDLNERDLFGRERENWRRVWLRKWEL